MNYEQESYEYKAWDKEKYFDNNNQVERIKTAREIIPKDINNLCDIGCGNGAFLYYLEQEKYGFSIKGLERSEAARKNKFCLSDIDEGDLLSLPYCDSEFDLTSCMEVLEHLPYDSYDTAIKELQRVTKKYILISVPYKEKMGYVQCVYCNCVFQPNYHVRIFDEKNLNELFLDFRIISYHYAAETYVPNSFVYKMMQLSNLLFKNRIYTKAGNNTVCPQCGFKKISTEVKKKNIKRNPLKSIIKQIVFRKKPRWIIALYERK